MVKAEELEYLNKEHAFSLRSKKLGVLGKIQEKLRNFILGDYFVKEQEYFANLVRYLNGINQYLVQNDLRREDLVAASIYSLEKKLSREFSAGLLELKQEISKLQAGSSLNQTQITAVDSVTKGLERMLALISVPEKGDSINVSAGKADFTYWLLENRFRGSEAEITSRLRIYPEIFQNCSGSILDLGCGRGELLNMFKERGITSYGIELNQSLLEHCLSQGLDVRKEDILEHLNKLEDHSLGGFIAIQVVEHLPYSLIKDLFFILRKKLKPQAKLVLETINVLSLVAFCHNFYRDPSHQPPIHPDTLRFTLEISGFKIKEIKKLSPFPEEVKLRCLEYQDHMPPRWQQFIETINLNINQLNNLLYSEQDYCIIAEANE